MRTTTGIFTLHKHTITFKKWNEPILLVPFGDVHRNAPLCNTEKWLESLDQMRKLKNAYFIGMGDYDDLASASEREVFASPKVHESTRQSLDDFAKAKTKELGKELAFMRGRCIGLLGGNHFWDFPDGTNTDNMLCGLLDCRYLGVSSVIRLVFASASKHTSTIAVDLWAHHGKGASRLVGGSFNRVEQMREAFHADVYLMGHDHKRGAVPVTIMEPKEANGKLTIHHKKQWLCRTGSFLSAYANNEQSYIVDAAKGPVDQGYILLQMIPKRSQANGTDDAWVDIHTMT